MDFIGRGYAIQAQYLKQVIPEYRDNPLIEALPNILSDESAVEQMSVYPEYHEHERELEPHYRYHCIQRLFRYFQPLSQHIDLEQRFSRIIRQGYLGRNPATKDYVEQLQRRLSESEHSDIRTTATALALIGISGIGKTTAIERILSLYPQIIIHNTPLNLYQISWLKLDCPFDGSLKGLCINFFMKVDELLGTSYFKKFGASRQSVDSMLAHMSRVASLHCIGVLIVDEIQHLSLAKSGGSDRMLNFFVTLVNTIGLPVILIGTAKAMSVMQSAFRQARRGTGQGDMVWNCIDNDENWEVLLEGMWKYQWTKKSTILSSEIKAVFYEESQGITDIAIKLYILAQTRAISTGIEEITPAVIRQVAKDSLQSVRPMLQALRSGDFAQLAQYDDIRPVNIEEHLKKYTSQLNIKQIIYEQKKREEEKRKNNSDSVIERLVLALLNLGIEAEHTQQIAKKVIRDAAAETPFQELLRNAFAMALNLNIAKDDVEKNDLPAEKGEKSKKQADRDKNDLREIISTGRKKKKSAYEALKEAEYIKSVLQDFAL